METLTGQFRAYCNCSSDDILVDPHSNGSATIGINTDGNFPHIVLSKTDIISLRDYLNNLYPASDKQS